MLIIIIPVGLVVLLLWSIARSARRAARYARRIACATCGEAVLPAAVSCPTCGNRILRRKQVRQWATTFRLR